MAVVRALADELVVAPPPASPAVTAAPALGPLEQLHLGVDSRESFPLKALRLYTAPFTSFSATSDNQLVAHDEDEDATAGRLHLLRQRERRAHA